MRGGTETRAVARQDPPCEPQSLRTSSWFPVACRRRSVGTGFLHCRVQRPAGRFSPCQLGGDVPRVWAVLVQS